MVLHKHSDKKTQCVGKDEKDDVKMETDFKRNSLLDQRGHTLYEGTRGRKGLKVKQKQGKGKLKPK